MEKHLRKDAQSEKRNQINESPNDVSNGDARDWRGWHYASRQARRCQAHKPQRLAIWHQKRQDVQVPHCRRRDLYHEVSMIKFTIGGESHEMEIDSWQRSNVSPSIELTVEAAKPDHLVRVINEVIYAQPHGDIDEVRMAKDFRAALDSLGFEIREKNDD